MGMLGETSLRAQRQAHALAIKLIYDLIRPSLAAAPGSRFDKADDGAYVRLE